MRRGGVDRLGHPGGGSVPPAVVLRAEVRAALDHLPGDPDAELHLPGVVAQLAVAPWGIGGGAAGVRDVGVVLEPVGGPFPHVARHVVEVIAVRRERADRRGPPEPVELRVHDRELTLPGVGHVTAGGQELVAPGVLRALQSSPRRELPFRLGWQLPSGPACVRLNVLPGDVHDGMLREAPDLACRSPRMPPVRTRHIPPPVVVVATIDPMPGLDEHRGPWHEQVRRCGGVVGRARRTLGHGDVAGLLHKAPEAFVGHLEPVHPEAAHGHAVGGRLLRIVAVGAHQELATRNPDHVGVGRRAGRLHR
jgi:hypothetical protein